METTELVLKGRRPTEAEAQLAARWLLTFPGWPDHDGPEMYEAVKNDDAQGPVWFLRGVADNNILDCGEVDEDGGEVWIGLDKNGDRVKVPTTEGDEE